MFFLFFKDKNSNIKKEIINKIEQCKEHLPAEDLFTKDFGIKLCNELIETIKTKWTNEHFKNYENNLNQGELHEGFIYNYLTHSVANKLESGQYHVYRGVLNLEGESLMVLLNHIIERSINLGIYNEVWAKKNLMEPILKNIKEIG
jgi:hypothetical protein